MLVPVIGWLLMFVVAFLASIPFYVLWNWLAPIYFTFLPPVWLAIPFTNCIGLCMLTLLVKILWNPSVVKGR